MQKGISSIDTVELKSADNFISALKSPFLPHEMSNYLKRLNITAYPAPFWHDSQLISGKNQHWQLVQVMSTRFLSFFLLLNVSKNCPKMQLETEFQMEQK